MAAWYCEKALAIQGGSTDSSNARLMVVHMARNPLPKLAACRSGVWLYDAITCEVDGYRTDYDEIIAGIEEEILSRPRYLLLNGDYDETNTLS